MSSRSRSRAGHAVRRPARGGLRCRAFRRRAAGGSRPSAPRCGCQRRFACSNGRRRPAAAASSSPGVRTGPGGDGPDHRRGRSFATAQQLSRPVFVGRRFPGTSAASQHGGGFDARLGRVKKGAQFLEGFGDRMKSLAVSGRDRVGVGGAGRHELAVHLGGEVRQAAGRLVGLAQAGQAVQRAGGTEEVADLFRRSRPPLRAWPGRWEGRRRRRPPRPGPGAVGLWSVGLSGRPRASSAASVSAACSARPVMASA